MYRFVFEGLHTPPTFTWLWKAKCMPRIIFFGWHLIMVRLNTQDMLQRRNSNVQSGTNCILCPHNCRETRDYLFFECVFVNHCWALIGITWVDTTNAHTRLHIAKQASTTSFFMDIFLVAAWEIWKLHNAIIFGNQHETHQLWI